VTGVVVSLKSRHANASTVGGIRNPQLVLCFRSHQFSQSTKCY